jgi:hypothetical protein
VKCVQEPNKAVSDPRLAGVTGHPDRLLTSRGDGTPNSTADSSVESVSRTHRALFADQER